MGFSMHVHNKKKYILILGERLTQELDGATLTAEKMYSIDFTSTKTRFCLDLHYNWANNYLFVNGIYLLLVFCICYLILKL